MRGPDPLDPVAAERARHLREGRRAGEPHERLERRFELVTAGHEKIEAFLADRNEIELELMR